MSCTLRAFFAVDLQVLAPAAGQPAVGQPVAGQPAAAVPDVAAAAAGAAVVAPIQPASIELVSRTQEAFMTMGNEFFTQLTDHCSERQYEPEPARMARLSNELQQRKAQITEDLLGLKHTKLFWDSVNAQLFVPGVGEVLRASKLEVSAQHLSAAAWHDLLAGVLAVSKPGPELLLEQIKKCEELLPTYWQKVRAVIEKYQQQQQRERHDQAIEKVAAAAAAAMSLPLGRASAGSRLPAVGSYPRSGTADAAVNNLHAVMDPVDAAWRAKPVGERGCQFWSGIEGSCLQPGCQAQHVPGQPSAWYAARAQVWQQLGCKPDEKGNYRLPTVAGYKRPALTDAGAESVASRSFRR